MLPGGDLEKGEQLIKYPEQHRRPGRRIRTHIHKAIEKKLARQSAGAPRMIHHNRSAGYIPDTRSYRAAYRSPRRSYRS